MRLSADILKLAEQRSNPLGERELVLRGMGFPLLEHLGATSASDSLDTIDLSHNLVSRLENFPKWLRLSAIHASNNRIERVDVKNCQRNVPNVCHLILDQNRIGALGVIGDLGKAFPKLEFLSLQGNPVQHRQHYRLYTIHHIPSLRCLDMSRIRQTERDRAARLFRSAAGAALLSDVHSAATRMNNNNKNNTFVPGGGTVAMEFTKEQQAMIRRMVERAKNPAELDEIETAVQKGVFPTHLLLPGETDGTTGKRKRNEEEEEENEVLENTEATGDGPSAAKKVKEQQ